MDFLHKDEIQKFLERHIEPAAVLDNELNIVYSSSPATLPVGSSFTALAQENFAFPLKAAADVMTLIGGEVCNARLTPFFNELTLCELYSASALAAMAARTDAYQRIAPAVSAIEHSAAKLWKTVGALRGNFTDMDSDDLFRIVSELERSVYNVSSVNKNLFEYVNMMFSPKYLQKLDIASLAQAVVARCNTFLAKCGRCVDFVYDPEEMVICADHRHALCALVNCIQNALIFSPKDTVPILSLCKSVENDVEYIVMRTVNESIFNVEISSDNKAEISFDNLRVGYGLPIIERFAADSGGRVVKTHKYGTYAISVMIPAAKSDGGEIRFESGGVFRYDTGIPDIIEIKMMEVVSLFS